MAEFCNDWGDKNTAKILIIGQDPNLRNSRNIPQYCFCADFYFKNVIKNSDKRKKRLARTTINQVLDIVNLGGKRYSIGDLYITNLCNEKLEIPDGKVVLVPEEKAEEGIERIKQLISNGNFDYVFSLSEQTNYWMIKDKVFSCDVKLSLNEDAKKANPPYFELSQSGEMKKICGHIYRSDFTRSLFIPLLHPKRLQEASEDGYEENYDRLREYFLNL